MWGPTCEDRRLEQLDELVDLYEDVYRHLELGATPNTLADRVCVRQLD